MPKHCDSWECGICHQTYSGPGAKSSAERCEAAGIPPRDLNYGQVVLFTPDRRRIKPGLILDTRVVNRDAVTRNEAIGVHQRQYLVVHVLEGYSDPTVERRWFDQSALEPARVSFPLIKS